MAAWLIVLFIGVASMAHGFDRRIVFDRLSLSEGLSQYNIFAFHEDHQGYLWMGTQNAADRFDGYQIQSFRHNPTDPKARHRLKSLGLIGVGAQQELRHTSVGDRQGGVAEFLFFCFPAL